LSLQRKEANEQLLRMSKGREFQIVGAATEKLLEPKHVRTRGTDDRFAHLRPFHADLNYLSTAAQHLTTYYHIIVIYDTICFFLSYFRPTS